MVDVSVTLFSIPTISPIRIHIHCSLSFSSTHTLHNKTTPKSTGPPPHWRPAAPFRIPFGGSGLLAQGRHRGRTRDRGRDGAVPLWATTGMLVSSPAYHLYTRGMDLRRIFQRRKDTCVIITLACLSFSPEIEDHPPHPHDTLQQPPPPPPHLLGAKEGDGEGEEIFDREDTLVEEFKVRVCWVSSALSERSCMCAQLSLGWLVWLLGLSRIKGGGYVRHACSHSGGLVCLSV